VPVTVTAYAAIQEDEFDASATNCISEDARKFTCATHAHAHTRARALRHTTAQHTRVRMRACTYLHPRGARQLTSEGVQQRDRRRASRRDRPASFVRQCIGSRTH
jgi:hypothetical protein